MRPPKSLYRGGRVRPSPVRPTLDPRLRPQPPGSPLPGVAPALRLPEIPGRSRPETSLRAWQPLGGLLT